jgi:dihydropteroate synthase
VYSIESDMPFTRRNAFTWQLRTRALALGERTLVMGVLNVTPDSFSDGGRYQYPETAAADAVRMLEQGADIVDVGGESTRPGTYEPISTEEELRRVMPVVEAVLRARPGAVISVDTYRAATAEAAVNAGAEIVNDISGFAWDAEMPRTCARLASGVVLMHTRGRSAEWKTLPALTKNEVVPLVKCGLAESLAKAVEAGLDRARVVLDPGYGFGKRFEENYPLLAHQDALAELGQPIMAGVSRKSFLGRTLAPLHGGVSAPMPDRGNATLAATVATILAGAHIVRVHDVRPAVEAARIADAILKGL